MAKVELKLKKSRYGYAEEGAQAIYDFKTGEVSGPDAEIVRLVLESAQKQGYVQLRPCRSMKVAKFGKILKPVELAACLVEYWDISECNLPLIELEKYENDNPNITVMD